MWNPIRIEMINLFAHKHSEYMFKNNSCTVIFGRNETDKGLENNGAGKTTIFEAISIALTGESLRNIKKDSFINREAEETEITFELHNSVLKKDLKVVRQFFRGNKSAKIEVWENRELNTQLTSVNEANKYILDLMGISKEDLFRYFIISQDNHYTFFTASDSEKKEIMNRITSADMIDPIVEELSNRYKKKSGEYASVELEIEKVGDRLEILKEQRQEILDADDTADEIASLEERIERYEDKIKDAENDVKEYSENIKAREEQIAGMGEEPLVAEIKKELNEAKKKVDELESEISANKKVRRTLKQELDSTATCPKCSHEFVLDSELNLEVGDLKAVLEETDAVIKNQERKLKVKTKKVDRLTKKVDEAESWHELVGDLKDDKDLLFKMMKRCEGDISDYKRRVSKWNDEIDEIKKRKKDDKLLIGINEKIESAEQESVLLGEKIIPLTEEIEMIKFWQFNMGRSGFMTYLANKSIKIIEGITNSFLRKFGVDISVLINGFTILKSGDVREKIDVFALNDGVTAEQFMAKSGGERGRVMLAGILGIQHLINLSTDGRGLNLLCFDECFHGMDSRGQENIIKIFEKMGITILVITQNVSESFNNENTLYVVKENNESRYISAPL